MYLFIHAVSNLDISRFHYANVIAYNCSHFHNLREINLKTVKIDLTLTNFFQAGIKCTKLQILDFLDKETFFRTF